MSNPEIYDAVRWAIAEVSPFSAEMLVKMSDAEVNEASLADLGLNSIDYAEIVHIVMDCLRIDLPLNKFTNVCRICEIVGVFLDDGPA